MYRTTPASVLYMEPLVGRRRASQPVLAGILAAVVGVTSSSAVIVAGLRGVGASSAQAASGLWPRLGRAIAAIPAPIAQAMLAGIVLELCLTPVRGLASHPWEVGPILLTWLVLLRLAPKWAVPAAFLVTLAVVGVDVWRHGGAGGSL